MLHSFRLQTRFFPRPVKPGYFDEKLTLFEMHRALLNGHFCNNIQNSENRDDARFDRSHREYEKNALDEVQVYRDVQVIEERKRLEGRSPKARFLSCEEQRAWEGLYSNLPGDVASDVERREGEQR